MKNNFGTNLKIAIKANGITQCELASQIGLSKKTISSYINNKSMPTISTLAKISEALSTPADWLLGLVGDEKGDNFEASFLLLSTDQRKIILSLMKTITEVAAE